jgi:hypothetical protein
MLGSGSTALDGGEWSGLLSGPFKSGERPFSHHWRGIWMSPIAGLDVLEKRKIYCPRWDSNYDFLSHQRRSPVTIPPSGSDTNCCNILHKIIDWQSAWNNFSWGVTCATRSYPRRKITQLPTDAANETRLIYSVLLYSSNLKMHIYTRTQTK